MLKFHVSLKGLGYKAQRAEVVAIESMETGDDLLSIEGLPTIDIVSIKLDVDTGDKMANYAKDAAHMLAVTQYFSEARK